MSVFRVFLVRNFPHSHRIRRDTKYLSALLRIQSEAGKCRPEKLQLRPSSTQCQKIIQNMISFGNFGELTGNGCGVKVKHFQYLRFLGAFIFWVLSGCFNKNTELSKSRNWQGSRSEYTINSFNASGQPKSYHLFLSRSLENIVVLDMNWIKGNICPKQVKVRFLSGCLVIFNSSWNNAKKLIIIIRKLSFFGLTFLPGDYINLGKLVT